MTNAAAAAAVLLSACLAGPLAAEFDADLAVERLSQWKKAYAAQKLDLSGSSGRGEGVNRSSVAELASLARECARVAPAAAAAILFEIATVSFGPRSDAAIGKSPERLERLKLVRVTDAARQVLFEIRTPEATETLARALAGPRHRVAPPPGRALAAEWLGATAREPVEPIRIFALARALREDPAEDVRLRAARSLGARGFESAAAPYLRAALSGDRADSSDDVRREAARAIGDALARRLDAEGADAASSGAIEGLLDAVESDAAADVRRAAIDALGRAPSLATVERLARFLASRPAGRDRLEFQAIKDLLTRITGAYPGESDPGAWLAWWENERDRARVATRPDGDSNPPAAKYASRFYGLPIVGERVVFVLDTSGSMSAPGGSGRTKIEEARAELEAAIEALPESVRFNIVVFSSGSAAWRKTFRRALGPSKADARSYFADRPASGSTDLFGGLMRAFGIDRVGGRRLSPLDLPDQIVLLSDGQPTSGLLKDPTDIRLEVRRLNFDDAVRIDAVALGDAAAPLLDRLAADNGGTCVRVEEPRAGGGGRDPLRARAAPRR